MSAPRGQSCSNLSPPQPLGLRARRAQMEEDAFPAGAEGENEGEEEAYEEEEEEFFPSGPGPDQYYEEVADTPNDKLLRVSQVDLMTQPEPYRRNTAKEELMLEYVAKFQRQFTDLHPKRRTLLMTARSECGSHKFICTTLRPTQLPFQDVYDYDKCSKFVADYIRYEPLELATQLPRHMPSPSATLGWQAGDCFDMAQVRTRVAPARPPAPRARPRTPASPCSSRGTTPRPSHPPARLLLASPLRPAPSLFLGFAPTPPPSPRHPRPPCRRALFLRSVRVGEIYHRCTWGRLVS